MEWITEHWDEIMQGLAALYALVSIIVGLTPTPRDDQWLRKIMATISPLVPSDARGTLKLPGRKAIGPLVLLLACGIAAGCGASSADRVDTARAVLDATAVTVTTLQETAVVTCDTTARVLIRRADSREEALEVDREIGERCDAVYQTFAAVRAVHDAALEAVDRVEDGRMEPADLIALLGRLSAVVAEAQDAWRQLRAVLEERQDDDEVSQRLERIRRWAATEARAIGGA